MDYKNLGNVLIVSIIKMKGKVNLNTYTEPSYNEKSSYYAEFWKTFIINQFMVNQLKELTENVASFDSQIKKLEVNFFKNLGIRRTIC